LQHSTYPHRSLSRLFTLCILLALLLAAGRPALAQPIRIMFLHHSCGQNLIEQGGVREALTALGYEFYDHGYNEEGLRLADGSYTGTHFDVPGDNTDPDGFAAIFAQPLHDPPDNTFSHLMQYDVIAFKSCFPTSNIWDDYQLNEYKAYYLAIRDRMDQYPDKIFIPVTMPPELPNDSDLEAAARARTFTVWLQSDEYLAGHPNVFVFDFFGLLAGSDNFLRPEYRVDEYDAHPNELANRTIGPLFVAFIDQAVRSYDTGEPRPTPAPATVPPAEATEPPVIAPPPTAGVIDDFEPAADHWETTAETGSTVECGSETGVAHGGATSLRIAYSIQPGGWGDCGRSFEALQDWSSNTGISLWLHSDGTGEWFTLMLFSGDPDEPTPFEVDFETTPESDDGWAQLAFQWTDFDKAEWVGDAGLAEIDPARMLGYGFSIGTGEGALWVDDVALVTGAEQPPSTSATSPAAPVATTEVPAEEPGGEEEEGAEGGICPGAVVLPLGVLGIALTRRRRR